MGFAPELTNCVRCIDFFGDKAKCLAHGSCVYVDEGKNKGCHEVGELNKRDTFVDLKEGESQMKCLARNKQGLGRTCHGDPKDDTDNDPDCKCGSKCVSKEGRGRPANWKTPLHLKFNCRICADNLKEEFCREEDGCEWATEFGEFWVCQQKRKVVCSQLNKEKCMENKVCKYKKKKCYDMTCPTNASEKKCFKVKGCMYDSDNKKCIVDDGKTPKKPSKKMCKKSRKDRQKCEDMGCKYSEKTKGGKTKKKCEPKK